VGCRKLGNESWETVREVEVGSGAGFILEVWRVDAWRVNSGGTDARKGGREPITACGPPRFPRGNHRHAHYYSYLIS
jgi:hypothetical protein